MKAWKGPISPIFDRYTCDGHVLVLDGLNGPPNRTLLKKLQDATMRSTYTDKPVTEERIGTMLDEAWKGYMSNVEQVEAYHMRYGWKGERGGYRVYLLVSECGFKAMVNAHKYRMFQSLFYPKKVVFRIADCLPAYTHGPYEYVQCNVDERLVGCIAQVRFPPDQFIGKVG